jgi:archaellum component FlaC
MDGKLTTPAALNGDVRTIPLIDKTLSVEGKCADAKATGDRFNAQAAIIEQHGKKIADNAAAIQTLRAENGVQDTTLGEHKALITDNRQRITACENGLGELHRKATEAEDAIDDLKEKVTTGEESFAEVFERLNEQATDINENYNMIMDEVKPELAEAKNDIEVLKAEREALSNGLGVKVFDITTTTEKINDAFASYYAKSLHFCHAVLNFFVTEDIDAGNVVFGGLPKPAVNAIVTVFNVLSGEVYSLDLLGNGNAGVLTSRDLIRSGSRYTGSIAYIVAADSYV